MSVVDSVPTSRSQPTLAISGLLGRGRRHRAGLKRLPSPSNTRPNSPWANGRDRFNLGKTKTHQHHRPNHPKSPTVASRSLDPTQLQTKTDSAQRAVMGGRADGAGTKRKCRNEWNKGGKKRGGGWNTKNRSENSRIGNRLAG